MRKWLIACMVLVVSAGGSGSAISRTTEPQVWLGPAPASRDLLRMFDHPDEWKGTLTRIDTFMFFQGATVPGGRHESFGDNNFESFMSAVPGGAFKWLTDRGKKIGMESGALKEYDCPDHPWRTIIGTKTSLLAIREIGKSRVDYISMDEPFTAGLAPADQPTVPNFHGCGYTKEKVAEEVKYFIDAIHEPVTRERFPGIPEEFYEYPQMKAAFPEVQIGLIEAYPEHTADKIMSYITELERVGVKLPYLHIDMDLYRVLNESRDLSRELPPLVEFCRQHQITFGMIIWGESGLSNVRYYDDAVKMMIQVKHAIGTPDRLVFESWSRYLPAKPLDLPMYPDNLPEWDPFTHTSLVNTGIDYFTQDSP